MFSMELICHCNGNEILLILFRCKMRTLEFKIQPSSNRKQYYVKSILLADDLTLVPLFVYKKNKLKSTEIVNLMLDSARLVLRNIKSTSFYPNSVSYMFSGKAFPEIELQCIVNSVCTSAWKPCLSILDIPSFPSGITKQNLHVVHIYSV